MPSCCWIHTISPINRWWQYYAPTKGVKKTANKQTQVLQSFQVGGKSFYTFVSRQECVYYWWQSPTGGIFSNLNLDVSDVFLVYEEEGSLWKYLQGCDLRQRSPWSWQDRALSWVTFWRALRKDRAQMEVVGWGGVKEAVKWQLTAIKSNITVWIVKSDWLKWWDIQTLILALHECGHAYSSLDKHYRAFNQSSQKATEKNNNCDSWVWEEITVARHKKMFLLDRFTGLNPTSSCSISNTDWPPLPGSSAVVCWVHE